MTDISPWIMTKPRLLEPGLWQLDTTRERYRVPAGGAIVIDLFPDDVFTVQDLEGGQPAEVVSFTEEGKGDPGLLGIGDSRPAEGLKAILVENTASAARLLKGLEKRSIEPADARAVHLFSPESAPGEEASFKISQRMTCAIHDACIHALTDAVERERLTIPVDEHEHGAESRGSVGDAVEAADCAVRPIHGRDQIGIERQRRRGRQRVGHERAIARGGCRAFDILARGASLDHVRAIRGT